MSQFSVKDYFATKKGIRDVQPSKRRKLGPDVSDDNEVLSKRPAVEQVTDQYKTPTAVSNQSQTLAVKQTSEVFTKMKNAPQEQSQKVNNANNNKAKVPASRSCRTRKSAPLKGQRKLTHLIVDKTKVNKIGEIGDEKSFDCEDDKTQLTKLKTTEEVTSVWDDHDESCQHTPRKRIMSEVASLSQGPKSRVKKTAARKLHQEETSLTDSFNLSQSQRDVKKKLDLEITAQVEKVMEEKSNNPCQSANDTVPPKSGVLNLVKEMSSIEGAISPLALTPEYSDQQAGATTTETTKSITPKLQDLSHKLKVLSKMDGQALKNRLKKKGILGGVKEHLHELSRATSSNKLLSVSKTKEDNKSGQDGQSVKDKLKVKGKLSEVKEKLQELSKVTQANKTESVIEGVKEDGPESLPAYQRFDYLVKEGLPTLVLPYTYRLLESAFQAMDTVVSMLHNRSEVCTFPKLKTSVQNITKRNFLEKTVGQVKTVLPNAYTFKQEKVPVYGQRTSPWVLTVEANLDEGLQQTKSHKGKLSFTASHILRRKSLFKSSLLKHVKAHHKIFLESLNPPMRVPDEKLTRWHPRFALDKVPDVALSSLPQSPDLQVHRSAKDVLEQVGKLNPRIEKALVKVAAESNIPAKENQPESKAATVPLSPVPSQSSLKGIPPALLAKIRAKEAQKMEQALTRNPAEEARIKMMGHLPEMIRILRSYFVTEKRPALPLENVIKKLGDSYHTGMSRGDLEKHVKLLKELAPEFLSIVEVKKGKFVKLDKNIDSTALCGRISNMAKANK